MKNKKRRGMTRETIRLAKGKLERKELLTEEECKTLSNDIEECANMGEIIEETYDTDIEVLFGQFNDYAEQSKEKLQNMLSVISEGRIPSDKDRQEFDETIDNLCGKYRSVCDLAQARLEGNELPDDGSPISDYYEALKSSESIFARLEEMKETLNRFISVQSMAANLTLALEPFQKDAKKILDMIESGTVTEIDDLAQKTAGPSLFMKAMDYEDLNTDEGNEMLDSLEADYDYPSRVTRGLFSKSYYIKEDALEDEVSDVIESESDNKDVIIGVQEAPEEGTEELGDEEASPAIESGMSVVDEVDGEAPEESAEADEHKEEVTIFTKTLIERGVATEEKNFGRLISDISSNETKKVSSTIFTNDVRKGQEKVLKMILRQLTSCPLLSAESLNARTEMPVDIADGNLDFLLKKGYLRKYKLIPEGEFYCSSPRLDKALTYKEASKFVGVRQLKDGEYTLLEDKASSAAARVAFLKLFINSTRNYDGEGIERYTSANGLMTAAFLHKSFITNKPEEIEVLCGAFWTDYDECDEFLDALKDLLGEGTVVVKRFVFAGSDRGKSKSILDALVDNGIDLIGGKNTFIYSLKDNKYYSYENDKELEVSSIWPGLREHVEDDLVVDVEGVEEPNKEEDQVKEEMTSELKQPDVDMPAVDENTPRIKEKEDGKKLASIEKIYSFLNMKKYYCATAYARAISLRDESKADDYDRIAYALNDPMRHCTYSVNTSFDLIPVNRSYYADALTVSTALRTFFSNHSRYDYNVKSLFDAIKEYQVLSDYTQLGNVLYRLVEFKDKQKRGMDSYADYRAKSASQLEDEMKSVRQEAKVFYDSTIIARKSERARQRRFLETKKLLFNADSDIGQHIKAVVDNDKEMQPLVLSFLQDGFIREGNTLSEDCIDDDLMWSYILKFWEQAGEKLMYRFRSDLMSRLRSNIVNLTSKALMILVRWCMLVERQNDHSEDDGSAAYKKIRTPLLEDILESIEVISKDIESGLMSDEEQAGLQIIIYTLDEIRRCIDGTYEASERKYFYAPFLMTEDVLLNESFYPELEMDFTDAESLRAENRIIKHTEKSILDPETRLKAILEDGGDDYGTARLIVEYLEETQKDIDVEVYKENINAGEEYAKGTADLKKDQFVGDLELAQSYGQIDNTDSSEDKKERILQIVETCYEDAMETSNYGFFERVMDGYLNEIRKKSKKREKDFIEQLDAFRLMSIKGITADIKDKKIAKIQRAIEEQNYTVAEDLLARVSLPEDDYMDVIDERFLKDFLDDYNDYYRVVSSSKAKFSTLVSERTRNKEERGGRRLADNWLPGGGNLGSGRLSELLSALGFNVSVNSITQQNPIGKHENFLVKTIPVSGGKRENYTHPIAAFGSGALTEGFRVVCLNGKYDAVGLIDVMKQIGNAKHTLILLDYALDKPERRALARKSKLEMGDKLFVVLDRTVMMYLVKNYDETKANRMLMALVTPFGYYQPYVWESSNVMPPEIFMGRKHELERIESPTGANIVYGGRQLGKSALLKKAKADIDGNENGDRSILIDIKGLDYKDTAKKVGHALYDEGILKEEITTTDWDELSRIIRRRLQSETNRIPYLLLLLDEADAFIESCESVNYKPFDALKEIQSIGTGRFKFVIAGLRNIVRFKRDAALGNNSVLTHLESMTVKPFQPMEARELMEIPLHYLGLEFPKENESLITLILATTNYFPGLIQMYCAKLLSAMRSKDYAGYEEGSTPIYEISDEHIKKVLADSEFTNQIREKFIITLKLDEDNYYYLIALIMAYLSHNESSNEGYSAHDIKEMGKTLSVGKIANMEESKLSSFMEELKELNVLRSTDEEHYLFTRFSFLQMMGTSLEVEDKIMECMEE